MKHQLLLEFLASLPALWIYTCQHPLQLSGQFLKTNWFCFSGECWLLPRVTPCPYLNVKNRVLEDRVATEAILGPHPACCFQEPPLPPPHSPPILSHSQPPPPPPRCPCGWSLVLLCQQETSPLILFSVNGCHPHDKPVSSFCNPCDPQGSPDQQPATSDFFQVISPRPLSAQLSRLGQRLAFRTDDTSPPRCLCKVRSAEVACQVRGKKGSHSPSLFPH